jgi:hypothetical protein
MEQCVNFCLNPHINPLTHKPFQHSEKYIYELILCACNDININQVFTSVQIEQSGDNYSTNHEDVEMIDDMNVIDDSASETDINEVQEMEEL